MLPPQYECHLGANFIFDMVPPSNAVCSWGRKMVPQGEAGGRTSSVQVKTNKVKMTNNGKGKEVEEQKDGDNEEEAQDDRSQDDESGSRDSLSSREELSEKLSPEKPFPEKTHDMMKEKKEQWLSLGPSYAKWMHTRRNASPWSGPINRPGMIVV